MTYRNTLVVLYLCVWIASAVNPYYFADWLLENVLVIVLALGFALTARKVCLSKLSNTLIFVFLCLHSVGAHYTYALVPYDTWVKSYSGFSFNQLVGWERNNFDRLVHFGFGLLLSFPIREILMRYAGLGPTAWSYLLPLMMVAVASTSFELIEWAAALVFGGELGQAYLGTQGDEWDSHKDTVLAVLGSFVALSLVFTSQLLRSENRNKTLQNAKIFKFNSASGRS